LRYFYNFFIFSFDLNNLFVSKNLLFDFLKHRGVIFKKKVLNYGSLLDGFYFLGWNFFHRNSTEFFVFIARDTICIYKNKLKNILKIYGNKNLLFVLNVINKEIVKWSCFYKFSDFIYDICGEMDLYLYRILWNFLKKRHPRRPKTWIYSKYWKFLFGRWFFFLLEPNTGKSFFLRSHSVMFRKIYRIPKNLNTFYFLDENKLNTTNFKKVNNSINSIYKLLWKKQSGLCLHCHRIIDFTKKSTFIIKFNNVNNFFLIHIYCKVY
jgi:RNA-directed DNA polymerase